MLRNNIISTLAIYYALKLFIIDKNNLYRLLLFKRAKKAPFLSMYALIYPQKCRFLHILLSLSYCLLYINFSEGGYPPAVRV